jgi:hypothetical protein
MKQAARTDLSQICKSLKQQGYYIPRLWLHRDAFEFPDSQVVLLQSLEEGQTATVFQLPATDVADVPKERSAFSHQAAY